MEFTDTEKQAVIDYLKRYNNSTLARRMLMCAYFGSKKLKGYISFMSYLQMSIRGHVPSIYATRNEVIPGSDTELCRVWHLFKDFKKEFFGFDVEIIMTGDKYQFETEIITKIDNKSK